MKSCTSCRHWQDGTCHALPPAPRVVDRETPHGVVQWPRTAPADSCGAWKPHDADLPWLETKG